VEKMATTLTQYAKNRRKEETTVITARLPNSIYDELKTYCDNLGLSINEAINLLVKTELAELKKEAGDIVQSIKDLKVKMDNEANTKDIEEKEENPNQVTIDDVINNSNDDETKLNTKMNNDDSAEMNTKVIHPKIINTAKTDSGEIAKKDSAKTTKVNSADNKNSNKRFTVKPFVVNNELPCPICGNWFNHSNFARHAKNQHKTSTEAIFTEYKDKAQEMTEAKKAEIAAIGRNNNA
jgi:antitoxin component of RelBE/YafQ-DinJ toxin-antitoxin module